MCKGTQRCLVALVTVLVLAAQHTASQPCLDGAAPVFEIRSLGQSHPEPGALNTITISLKASVPLASSSSIIISGLSGAVEAPRENEPLSGIIPLQGTYGGRPGLFCAFPMSSEQKPQWVESSNAAWDDKEHILTMYVCPGAEVLCEEFRFAVTVRNAADPQVAPAISVEARDASGGSTIPKVRMDGPRGHMMLLGVPQGLVALHIQNTTIPESVQVVSPRGQGLAGLAASLSGPVEIWLRPGWYQETNCNLLWTQNVTKDYSHQQNTMPATMML